VCSLLCDTLVDLPCRVWVNCRAVNEQLKALVLLRRANASLRTYLAFYFSCLQHGLDSVLHSLVVSDTGENDVRVLDSILYG